MIDDSLRSRLNVCETLPTLPAVAVKIIELANDPNNTRKPKPFMAIQAQKDFPEIDFEKSVMVGDTDSDLTFGENLGMKTVLIRSNEKTQKHGTWEFDSLHAFAQELLKRKNA